MFLTSKLKQKLRLLLALELPLLRLKRTKKKLVRPYITYFYLCLEFSYSSHDGMHRQIKRYVGFFKALSNYNLYLY